VLKEPELAELEIVMRLRVGATSKVLGDMAF
jgi:hypothetical protein